jgi:DNA invertase Pin-like site-specific DNA recombinase
MGEVGKSLDSCGMFRDPVIAILGAIAKQERVRISERRSKE